MRRLALPLIVAALAAACGGPSVDPSASLSDLTYRERGVPFVDAETLAAWMDAGHAEDVVFVDNRNAFAFQQQRVEGARLIPTEDIATSMGKLPVNKWAVFYCT